MHRLHRDPVWESSAVVDPSGVIPDNRFALLHLWDKKKVLEKPTSSTCLSLDESKHCYQQSFFFICKEPEIKRVGE